MLDAAGLALSQGALIAPPGQNALELYRAVLVRDPTNALARRGIDSVADELIVQPSARSWSRTSPDSRARSTPCAR
jgi:hypothetical protein